MDNAEQNALNEAMNRMWAQFLPQLLERAGTLEVAAAALAAGTFTSQHREQAVTAAHKLAGVLGTFGLTKGTLLARQAESLYSAGAEQAAGEAAQLEAIASQLCEMIANRQ